MRENPYSWKEHTNYIEALRKLGDKHRLREARSKMNAIFPLSEFLWKEWLSDEQEHAKNIQDVQFISDLFKIAVKESSCKQRENVFVVFMFVCF